MAALNDLLISFLLRFITRLVNTQSLQSLRSGFEGNKFGVDIKMRRSLSLFSALREIGFGLQNGADIPLNTLQILSLPVGSLQLELDQIELRLLRLHRLLKMEEVANAMLLQVAPCAKKRLNACGRGRVFPVNGARQRTSHHEIVSIDGCIAAQIACPTLIAV